MRRFIGFGHPSPSKNIRNTALPLLVKGEAKRPPQQQGAHLAIVFMHVRKAKQDQIQIVSSDLFKWCKLTGYTI